MDAFTYESGGGEAGGFAAAAFRGFAGARVPWTALTLTVLSIAIFRLGENEFLQYDRSRFGAGEFWRAATCQWTHWSFDHLFWDAAVFAALGTVCETRRRLGFLLTVLLSTLAVPLAVHVFSSTIVTFRGLSGIDSALFGWLWVDLLRSRSHGRASWTATLIPTAGVGFVAKIGFEVITGHPVFVDPSDAGFVVVPIAHAVGMGVGCAVGLLSRSHRVEDRGLIGMPVRPMSVGADAGSE